MLQAKKTTAQSPSLYTVENRFTQRDLQQLSKPETDHKCGVGSLHPRHKSQLEHSSLCETDLQGRAPNMSALALQSALPSSPSAHLYSSGEEHAIKTARGAVHRPASALTCEMQSQGNPRPTAQEHLRPASSVPQTSTTCPLLAGCLFVPRQFISKLTLSPRMQFMRCPSQRPMHRVPNISTCLASDS